MVQPQKSLINPLPGPPSKGEGEFGAGVPSKVEGGKRHRASVRLATWLSAVPGLGQLYNREPLKGAAFLAAVLGFFLITLNIPGVTAELLALWKPRGSAMVVLSLALEMLSLLLFMTTFLLGLTAWYDAMHDARRTAQIRNGERQPSGRWWLFHR